jgi:signal transduction histidine kinase
MAKSQTPAQKATVERVMHEFKEGELRTGSDGAKVKTRRQAIAIALGEAGASDRQAPKRSKQVLAKTKRKEKRGETAQAETEGRKAQDRTLAKGARGGKKG